MSLDVYLVYKGDSGVGPERQAIFIREDGTTREITRDEWEQRYPGREPVTVTVGGESEDNNVFSNNITHNLGSMAGAAGVYKALWRPEEVGVKQAKQLVPLLKDGLAVLQSDPEKFKKLNPDNGWGDYDGLCNFVAAYLEACMRHPDAEVSVWR